MEGIQVLNFVRLGGGGRVLQKLPVHFLSNLSPLSRPSASFLLETVEKQEPPTFYSSVLVHRPFFLSRVFSSMMHLHCTQLKAKEKLPIFFFKHHASICTTLNSKQKKI